jgi:hypothetical protein
MSAFATPDDVANKWRTLTDKERSAAESDLDRVAALIRGEFRDRLGLEDVPDDRVPAAKAVSIDVVKTALATAFVSGHISYGRTEGPRSKSGTLAVPGGSIALSDWHRVQLGLPRGGRARGHFPIGNY